jgi:hypothetical protein
MTLKSGTLILLLAGRLAGPFIFAQSPGASVEDLTSLIHQKSGLEIKLDDEGWTWKPEEIQGTPESGQAVFSDTKWLMYLIHWGPIQKQELTTDYVRDRMLKMWGVPFEFTGQEGHTTMAGHDAVFVEAFGTKHAFRTRFIVWNCPESGREFIADTNYNLVAKTPVEDFEAERRSARTLACHDGAPVERFPDLHERFAGNRVGFTFDYPERWFLMDSPFYVPFPQYEGIRDENTGSLLLLCSDQNVRVVLQWGPAPETADPAAAKTLDKLVAGRDDIVNPTSIGSETFRIGDKTLTRIWGDCSFKEPEDKDDKDFFTGRGIYQAARWLLPERKKAITAIMTVREYSYSNHPSRPDRDILDRFVRDLVLSIR